MRNVIPGNIIIFKGRHSNVIALEGLNIAIKVFPITLKNNAYKEINAIRLANEKGINCIPKYIAHVDTDNAIFLFKEYIKGIYFIDFIKSCDENSLKETLLKLFRCLNLLDKLGIVVKELARPRKNIVIREGKPFLIDLERWTYTKGKTNITQFLGYIYSVLKSNDNEVSRKFKNLIISDNLKEISEQYKKTLDLNLTQKLFKNSF
ncbi:MAG: hypothetical protein ACP6IP_05045 [Candidatus Njordarchaeia archaeon]